MGTDTDTSTESGPVTTGTTIFVPDTDQSGVSECDPWLQDCPEGEKCVPYGSTGGNWDANKCVAVMGAGAPGDPCTYGGVIDATDDCDETSHCWNVVEDEFGEWIGTCYMFCQGTADDPWCPLGFHCPLSSEGSVTLCHPTCDPLVQDCEEEGLSCYWVSTNFACVFESQNIEAGQPCGYINDCAGGLLCTADSNLPACEGSACCTPFCALDQGDAGCAALPGTSCVPFFDMPEPNEDANLGVCIVA